jgi:hypothetical protein
MSKEPKTKKQTVAKAPKLSRKVRHFGVDLDGSTVRVVEVYEGQVVSYTTYQGPDTAAALAQFMAIKPVGAITLAWSAGNIHVRRVVKPHLPEVALRAGLSEVVDESLPTPPGTTMVAARTVLDAEGNEHAAVAAVDNESVTQIFATLGTAGAPLVPTPLLFTVDGLYLGLRESTADLYLVLGGAITAARPLSAGGLSAVYSKLAAEGENPLERFATVTRGGGRLDPAAAAFVDQYASSISDEVRRTSDFWIRQALAVPSEIFVHGPGAILPNLAGKLLDAAFLARPAAPVANVEVEAIPRPERPAAHVALLAALFEAQLQPMAVLPDPMAAVKGRKAKERRKKQRTILAVSGAVLAGLAALVMPNRLAQGSLEDAKSDQKKMDEQILTLQPQLKLAEQVKAIKAAQLATTATEPAWNIVVQKVLASAPLGAVVQYSGLTLAKDASGITLAFSVTITQVPDFNPVALWLDNLTALGAIDARTPNIAKQASESTDVQLVTSFTATLPLSGEYLSERAVPVAAPVPVATDSTTTPTTAPATTPATDATAPPAAGG